MGLKTSLRIALAALRGDRSLLPDFELDSARDLDPEELHSFGIRHVVFDFDSTLANWGRRSLPEPSRRLIRSLLEAGITVAIASNGYGDRFRKLNEAWRADDVVFLGRCGKPDHTKVATFLEERGWNPQETLVVGDNVMADVAAARGAGCRAALVRPWSWFEFPLTKIWRFLEDIHRIRLRSEWRQIPHIGSGPARRQWIALPEIALLLLVAGLIGFMYLPLVFGPMPASEISSLQLGMARDLRTGWPIASPNEPERSLLVSGLLSVLPDTTMPGAVPRALSGLVIIGGAFLAYGLLRRNAGAFSSILLVLAIWLSPALLASAGEFSPSMLEVVFAMGVLAAGGRMLVTGGLFFLALLNGLSAVALIPVIFIAAGKHKRRHAAAVVGVVLLLGCACWVRATTREPVPGPGWDSKTPEQGSMTFSSFKAPSSRQIRSLFLAIEHDVHRGILGRPDLNMRLPVILGAFVLALPFLTQRTPGAVWYLFGRAALVLLAPGLFARPMLLIVFLPFVFLALTTVLRRVVRGYALPAFAVLLAFLVLSNAVSTRRQILLARRNYRANPEFILLAKTAPEVLHPDARIATPSPALFHLFSGLQTVPPLPDSSMSHVTHKVTPRTDAPHEACILQERLMLCPA